MNATTTKARQTAVQAPPITRAMVLAAGLGTRMRAVSGDLPKPLVKVAGKALIDHVLDRLAAAGVEEAVVNLHYKAEAIEAHLKSRRVPRIAFSDERGQLLDTGGGVAKALPHFKGEPFFYSNSDTVWREGARSSLADMRAMWDAERMDALMLVAPTVRSTGYEGRGDFTMDREGHLTRREEKRVAPFVWAGVQIVHPRLFEGAPQGAFSTNVLWDRAAKANRLFGIRLEGLWMHVGSPDGLKAAEAALQER
ncbi:MAG: nucleotidyltransferase family protein [Alphaproteobacteria bacterium]